MGITIGKQARLVGIHLNLAPVVDINSNPDNPIINLRSFGSDPIVVSQKASAVIRGFHKSGLLACAKHFPGHGDTSIDSHQALPKTHSSYERLNEIEFLPFRAAIKEDVDAVMSAHILVLALDQNRPATLSCAVLQEELRDKMSFQGLIITDALNMKALTDSFTVEEIALFAHEAGADLLLYGDHVSEGVNALMRNTIPRAYRALLDAYQNKRFDQEQLDASVLRILRAKEKAQILNLSLGS